MRLQQLYIKGFKSFATETVINFNERVTGIVGPNGSGKSNIVDAIRWVLGEQKSRELRLERMGDVLFNGTKKRKPSPVARVNLTFSNDAGVLPTEYSTVNISRVLYRSGESEYLLNDVPCRLKDIQSLFMDTGIGSDSYAIIALGMVDDILADKENARSKMFEQAAGISKYKKRKRETLLKLKSTEEDLNRVEDLLFEIEENLKSLERQARRTKKYFEIKASYREKAIRLSIAKSSDLKSRYDDLKKSIAATEDALRGIGIKRTAEESRLEKERNALLEKESHLSGLQKALNQLLSDLRQVENDVQIKRQQLQFTGQNISQALQQKEDNENRVAISKKELEALEVDLQRVSDELSQKANQLERSQDEFRQLQEQQSVARNSLNELAAKRSEIENSYQEIEKRMAVNANRKEQIGEDVARINERRQSIHEKSKVNNDHIAQLKQEVKKCEKELSDLERLALERKEKLEQLEKDIEKWQERLNEAHRKWDARKNERDLLKSMVDKLEGFPESIKFLNKQWDSPSPILSDLLYCQEKYRPAVEWILEPFLNHYVVRNYQEALSAISLLSNSQKGKANFIILDQLPRTDTTLAVVPDAIPALDIIEVDSTYKQLFHHLLNSVYLVNDERWSQLMENDYPDLTLVSESGTYMKKGHVVSGGSIGLFEGKKLGRKKNLEKLEGELADLGKKKQKIDEELVSLKRDQRLLKEEDIEVRINKVKHQATEHHRSLVQWETQQKGQQDELELLDEREKELELQLDGIKANDEQIAIQLKETAQKRNLIEKDVEKAGGAFGSTDELVSNKREELNQIRISHIQTQNKKEQLSREVTFRKNAINDLTSRIKTNEDSIIRLQNDKINCEKEISELESRLAELHEKRKNESANLQEVETRFFAERNTIQEIEKGIRGFNREFQDAQTRLNEQKDQFNEVRLQVHSISERLEAEFNLSLEAAIKEYEALDLADIFEEEEKIARLKVRLQNFGEINPMAVEAYEAMKERYDMISGQREDILEAKESLHQTISEIEQKATEQFLEAFHEVRDHFRQVFRELFTQDDDCDLILLNEEDPLESGIEIIAKPKGKRPKSLSQLSGGEKTLTATALLFALYLLKPAPFCIFDEVDAPLDDANIQKFNKIIKKFSEDSQFIIITHNKLTMAAVDIIYGVYMEETGVSNVSAVDFRHLEHQEMIAN